MTEDNLENRRKKLSRSTSAEGGFGDGLTMRNGRRALGLDLVTLRVFVAAAEEGTFGQAAERENISVSAVSRRISSLEARAGVLLFDRYDRGVQLTHAGKQFLEQARDVLSMLERAGLYLESIRGGTQGLVRIRAQMSAASFGLPAQIANFLAANPGIEVELKEDTIRRVQHAVRAGLADLGVVTATSDEDLQFIPWRSDKLVAVMPAGHPLTNLSSVSLSDLAPYPIVGLPREGGLATLYGEHAKDLGVQPRIGGYAASFESTRKFVVAGLGLAVLPHHAVEGAAEAPALVIRPVSESWAERSIMLCFRKPVRLSGAARRFLTYISAPDGAPANERTPPSEEGR